MLRISSKAKRRKKTEEMLLINGIEYDGDEYKNPDVFLKSKNAVESGLNNAEFAGSCSSMQILHYYVRSQPHFKN